MVGKVVHATRNKQRRLPIWLVGWSRDKKCQKWQRKGNRGWLEGTEIELGVQRLQGNRGSVYYRKEERESITSNCHSVPVHAC